MVKNDDTERYTEIHAKNGRIGLIQGAEVIKKSIDIIKE